jgi:hypothetical protein
MKSKLVALFLLLIGGQSLLQAQQAVLCLVSLGDKSCQLAFGDPSGSQYCSGGSNCHQNEWGGPWVCPGAQTEVRLNPNWYTVVTGAQEAPIGEPGTYGSLVARPCKKEKKCGCFYDIELGKHKCVVAEGNWVNLTDFVFTYGVFTAPAEPCLGGFAE